MYDLTFAEILFFVILALAFIVLVVNIIFPKPNSRNYLEVFGECEWLTAEHVQERLNSASIRKVGLDEVMRELNILASFSKLKRKVVMGTIHGDCPTKSTVFNNPNAITE